MKTARRYMYDLSNKIISGNYHDVRSTVFGNKGPQQQSIRKSGDPCDTMTIVSSIGQGHSQVPRDILAGMTFDGVFNKCLPCRGLVS